MISRRVRGAALLATAATLVLASGCSGGGSAAAPSGVEQPDLNVAVVPALDSAGFFIALYDGLFAQEGLNVHFIPATSSETVIDQQALSTPGSKNELDITGGNYVSYIQAQENWNLGERPASSGKVVAANLDIFAEGSVMEAGAQAIYTMPNSSIKTLADLKNKTIGINAPNNILYLLAASVLSEHGISPKDVRFVSDIPFPQMAAALKAGTINAAVLPEPFASAAEEGDGAVVLADLNQGATTSFPIEGYAVTKQWAQTHPKTLAAFDKALEEGQEIADTDRAAVEQAMEDLPAPLGLNKQTAAVMALDNYPVTSGPAGTVDKARLQRVVDVMQQFLGFDQSFNINSILMGG